MPPQSSVVDGAWQGLDELAERKVRQLVEVGDTGASPSRANATGLSANTRASTCKALPAKWNPARAAVRTPNTDATDGASRRKTEPSQIS